MGFYDVISFLRIPIGWCLDTLTALFNNVPFIQRMGSYGLAIIATTLIIRALLFPVFGWQLRTTRRTQSEQRKVAPQISELRKKYRKSPAQLSEEMKKVYAEHGISPFSGLMGCLPALLQAPVLIGLYRAISVGTQHLTTAEKGFLWLPDVSHTVHDICCGKFEGSGMPTWVGEVAGGFAAHPTLLILPTIAAIATYMQSRMMMPPIREDMTDQERSMVGMTKNLSYMFPVMIFIFSVNFAQGLALYWVTSTSFMVAQQYHLVGWGSLHVPSWVPGAHRVTSLSHPKPGAAGAGPTRPARSVAGQPSRVTAANGKNGSVDGRSRKPTREERETITAEPSLPGQGRAPTRASSRKKRRR